MEKTSVINNCMVIDGSGGQPYPAAVVLVGDRIDAVQPGTIDCPVAIDGSGLALCPGFIDVHTHSDVSLQIEPLARSRICQGITTEVIGNCGFSPAPAPARRLTELKLSFGPRGRWLNWGWQSVSEYLDALEVARPAVNVLMLVGHGTLRRTVMDNPGMPAGPPEIRDMEFELELGLAAGAGGMSSGLAYAPGLYAAPDELDRLAGVLARAGRVYATHVRNEGRLFPGAVSEALATAATSGCRLQISHVKLLGSRNWGQTADILGRMEQAVDAGVDVKADFYPYEAGSTALSAFFPPWILDGGTAELVSRLKQGPVVERLHRAFESEDDNWWNPVRELGWENLIVSRSPGRPEAEGHSVRDLSPDGSPVDAAIDLLIACDGQVDVVAFGASIDDLAVIAAHELTMVGSDGLALGTDGPTASGLPHPRSFGTYPRALELFTQKAGMDLAQAVRKMTLMPAEQFGLHDRGRIAAGCRADLVMFDPERFRDLSTYRQPFAHPDGIESVWVNGRQVVSRGLPTGERPGMIIRQ